MRDEYDIVVVGAGPAGLQFAREVTSRTDHSVAVLERNGAVEDNDKSTGGTFEEVIDGYDIPDAVVMDRVDSVTFEGPNTSSRLDIDGYVLDFPEFLEFLAADAESDGCEVYTGVNVTAPIVEDGAVRGVRCHRSGDEREVRATVTVDATGPAAALTSQMGLFDRATAQRGIGLEFEARGTYETTDTMLFRFDHTVAPGGYAWTFPAGENVFKAGVCWVDDFYATRGDARTIHECVEQWARSDPRWTVERIRTKHAGEVLSNNSINRRATDGFVAVGDSVSSINPLFGEGIRPGMESAEMAAAVVIDALATGDAGERRLREYEHRWNERKGRAWKLQRIVGELLYDFDADQQDGFVDRTGDMPADTVERLRTYRLTVSDLVSLYPFKWKDLPKVPDLLRHL